ncbi:NF-kappa-B inhibitor alpha [Pleurostoma richardsiae]|uniref:NF-kappa-B inhibitor alpha n=1 Tax=Pleurostoma richardsiae TaxID=41990 RepID=A0AA38RJC7_9PEZI|nr:NF-kappa-B inhibitor alpha [Pleurostoma richardsiae]
MPVSQEERQWRLRRLAAEWGIEDPPDTAPLTRPSVSPLSPTFSTPNDDFLAEELLKRRRLSSNQGQNHGSADAVKRAFTLNKKKTPTYDPREIFDALDQHVGNGGSAGVAEVLVRKLLAAGGDLSAVSTKTRTSLLTRRRSLETFQRGRVLQKAIQSGEPDMVAVLAPHCDSLTLDTALPPALESGSVEIIEVLLRHGASVAATTDGQDAFRAVCAAGGQADVVGLVLRSDGRPSPTCVSDAMVDAARKGCADTVLRLSRSTADGSHNSGEALKEGVAQCRVDVALAILTGGRPPGRQALAEAFAKVFTHPTIMPNEKLALAEVLLCAGAEGDVVSAALVQACSTGFYEMVGMLTAYGASVEFQDAQVLREAIARGNLALVQLLLNDGSVLGPACASACVSSIPKKARPEDRYLLLDLLLRRGAAGPPLHDALIHAIEAEDMESAKLLLTPHFPGGRPAAGHDLRKGPRSMVFERHQVADVNRNGGSALQLAVLTANLPVARLMLACGPSADTLAEVFPCTGNLAPVDRYHMAELFLATGLLPAACVHAALQEAIEEQPGQRDERLIRLLLRHDADVNFNDGAALLSAVEHGDSELLATLLRSGSTPQTAAMAVPKAMLFNDTAKRAQMVGLLADAGAGLEGKAVAEALVMTLEGTPTDAKLLEILLKQGKADINFDSGKPLVLAVRNGDPAILELLLQSSKPTPETLTRALKSMSDLPSTPTKATKLSSLLARAKHAKEALNDLLVTEVQAALAAPPPHRTLAAVKALLAAGADVNAHKAAALCHAVAAACAPLADMLFAARPRPQSLQAAMPHALRVADPMDRLTLTRRLLAAGAPAVEANRALVFAVAAYPADLPLIGTLAAHAEAGDGEALTAAVKRGRPEVVEVILSKARRNYTVPVLNGAFAEATKIDKDKGARKAICELLLKAGASGPVVSDALLAAAGSGDLVLGAVLLDRGASVEHQDGQAIVEACRAGAPDVLKMLLSGKAAVKEATLARGFQAATEVGDLGERAAVFHLLLEKGVSGEVVDAQLVSAARFGDDALGLVRLLLEAGASTDYNSGEAVWNATRCAFLGILELMLGVADNGAAISARQRRPSHATMARALKASWRLSPEPRYKVIEWLFRAGLPATEDVHVGLHKAVNEDEPNMALVRLLLANGASPLTNGCQTLVDAAQKLRFPVLDVFLEGEIPQKDVNWAFSQVFTSESAEKWLCEDGLKVAQRLLEKGAGGEGLSGALAVAIDHLRTEKDGIARRFVDLLVQHKADVNWKRGLPLCKAAKSADAKLIRQLLQLKPNGESLSMAFSYLFDHELPEQEALEMVTLFTDYHEGCDRLDVMFAHPESQPVVFRAIAGYPRSSKMLEALLHAGYYHDQMGTALILPEPGQEEPVNLLTWCLLQPQKKVSSSLITMLIDKGAKVNFETRLSKTTPLMLAIQSRRQDLVKALILAGAEVDVADVTGNTPLTMATGIGGDLGTLMMTNILAAEPSKNDGSLHNAARELDLGAMQVLIDFGHEVDFPSPLHGGRSALGELCLHAAGAGELTAAREKAMEKAMDFLMQQGTDLSLLSDDKSVLLLAMESSDPVNTTKALLKVGMWKLVNKPFNHFTDGTHTYSPTMYASRVLATRSGTQNTQLLALLKANRATDVFYANEGPQPADAVGLPDHILLAERERRARTDRLALEDADHARRIAHTRELATLQDRILAERAEIEEARARRQRESEVAGLRARAALEDEVSTAAAVRRAAERTAALEHAQRLAVADLDRTRQLAEAEVEAEGRRQLQALEYERAAGQERVDAARQMSAVRAGEREEEGRADRERDGRARARMAEQRRLVEQQGLLAGRLQGLGVGERRQIGYVTGELD